jgi:hypothetical protein
MRPTFILCVLWQIAGAGAPAAPLPLVEKGRGISIILPARPAPVEGFAGQPRAAYPNKVTGVLFHAAGAAEIPPGPVLVVGRAHAERLRIVEKYSKKGVICMGRYGVTID